MIIKYNVHDDCNFFLDLIFVFVPRTFFKSLFNKKSLFLQKYAVDYSVIGQHRTHLNGKFIKKNVIPTANICWIYFQVTWLSLKVLYFPFFRISRYFWKLHYIWESFGNKQKRNVKYLLFSSFYEKGRINHFNSTTEQKIKRFLVLERKLLYIRAWD